MRTVALLLALLITGVTAADETPWQQLRAGGLVVLWRHTETTPGTGDPPGFRLDDCATQRNLSPQGREQARRIGAALRAREVKIGAVLTSRWCRAIDTAEFAFGRHEPWPELDSTFDNPAGRDRQAQAARRRIAAYRGADNLFLVGHGANIFTLTGIHPSQGGMVIVAPQADGFRVVGTLEPEQILAGRNEVR